MGTYINRNTLLYFMNSTRNLVEGKAMAVRCTERKIKLKGLDLDRQHRALRLMTKKGYLKAKKIGGHIDYTIAPKGVALYDSLIIYLEQP